MGIPDVDAYKRSACICGLLNNSRKWQWLFPLIQGQFSDCKYWLYRGCAFRVFLGSFLYFHIKDFNNDMQFSYFLRQVIACDILGKFPFFCLWKGTFRLGSRHLVWYKVPEVYQTLDFLHLPVSSEITPDGGIPASSHLHLFLSEAICSLWEQTE